MICCLSVDRGSNYAINLQRILLTESSFETLKKSMKKLLLHRKCNATDIEAAIKFF